jgi:RNase P/RNase MRP subunit p29
MTNNDSVLERIEAVSLAKHSGKLYGVLIDRGEIVGVFLRVVSDHSPTFVGMSGGLAYLERNMRVVRGASAVPPAPIPRETLIYLVCGNKGMDASSDPALIPVLEEYRGVGCATPVLCTMTPRGVIVRPAL